MQFIQLYNGDFCNLSTVSKIVRRGKSIVYDVFALDGKLIGEVWEFNFACLNPIVPSLPGEAVFEFYSTSTERRPNLVKELVINKQRILGWRCGQSWATPVTMRPCLNQPASKSIYRTSDGRYADDLGKYFFVDFDKAGEYALECIRGEWPADWSASEAVD